MNIEGLTQFAQRLRNAASLPPAAPLLEAARRAAQSTQGELFRRPPKINVLARGNTVRIRGSAGREVYLRHLTRELERARQEVVQQARRQISG